MTRVHEAAASIRRVLCAFLLVGVSLSASGFVLIGLHGDGTAGPVTGRNRPNELQVQVGATTYGNNLSTVTGGGTVFGMGVPKDLRRFFRWNIPYLVYSFDASFVNYFGFEGMEAVHDAVEVLNDFFSPKDGSYNGVTALNLSRHGFAGNFNTAWVNTTAQNAQILDIKSMVLGMMVNHLGLGNPHRHAFTLTGGTQSAWQQQINFQVNLRNYDPYTLKETDIINGVQYAYRLIHDAQPAAAGALPAAAVIDVEEFTADTSGNAWTSVAAIMDAFYGETRIYWTDQPTLFNFGVYYDKMNAMGGQYQPRHTLTLDDAGGLKYLYSTNTYAWEQMDGSVAQIYPAQFLPENQQDMRTLSPNWSGIPSALHFRNGTGKRLPVWPRGGALIPAFRYTLPIFGQPVIGAAGTLPANAWPQPNNAANFGPGTPWLRGGIDKIQFYHQPFDSLLGVNFVPTNFTWSFPFIWNSGYTVGGLTNMTPGSSAWLGQSQFKFYTMSVGRVVGQPDFIFVADDLGLAPDGVPIAYTRGTAAMVDNFDQNLGFWDQNLTGLDEVGPGVINPAAVPAAGAAPTSIAYTFTKLDKYFELIWSGEATVTGNQESYYTIWGHIKGPGPNDLVVFPRDATAWRIENDGIPDAAPPIITMISDNGGATPIEQNTYSRSEEVLSIIGIEMASVTSIEFLDGELVLQTISPADKYIQSNKQIDIPAGVITDAVEGNEIAVRVWNKVGVSEKAPQKFRVETGRPRVLSTTADGIVYDRAEVLTIHGFGFKSKTGNGELKYIRVDDSQGSAVYDSGISSGGASDGLPVEASFEVVDDTTAVLTINAVNSLADGSSRRIRVSRDVPAAVSDLNKHLSPGTNPVFAAITTKPVISTLNQLQSDGSTWEDVLTTGMYKRDRIIEINGTALNTLSTVEIVREDGTSFANPVFIQLPNPAVVVEDNGTRVRIGASAIPYPDADTNGTVRRALRLYNAAGKTDMNGSLLFAVNTQPKVTGMGGFANAGAFIREKLTGDDVAIHGSGLLAVGEIHIIKPSGADINATAGIPRIILPHPGVTVSDTRIFIDTQIAQFSNGPVSDSLVGDSERVFKLVSARDNATTPVVDRFTVGVPPVFTRVSSLTNSNHYRRDSDVMSVEGVGLGMVSSIEVVDMFGVIITGATSVTVNTGINVSSGTQLTIDANASGWAATGNTMDHVTALGRRLLITTPYGTVTSYSNATGAFTVSANPTFSPATTPVAQNTFQGGGYNGASGTNGTYLQSGGNLMVNGQNFRGVKTLTYVADGVDLTPSITIDPNNPPANYAINSGGTQIQINAAGVPNGWLTATDAQIKLTSAADINGTTPVIATGF